MLSFKCVKLLLQFTDKILRAHSPKTLFISIKKFYEFSNPIAIQVVFQSTGLYFYINQIDKSSELYQQTEISRGFLIVLIIKTQNVQNVDSIV
jgi:hypothetical protein